MASMQWFRVWHDMVKDPKWRVIARKSGSSVSEVIAVAIHLMTSASENDGERGHHAARAEDIAASLDMDDTTVENIIKTMQGRFLEGERISAWEKRQPKRDDVSTERTRAWRERKKTHGDACVTHGDAPEKDTDTEIDTEKNILSNSQNTKTSTSPASAKEVFKNKNDERTYDVIPLIGASGIEQVRKVAPNWDVYALAGQFNASIRAGSLKMPDKPLPAFLGWIKKNKRANP